VPGKINTSMFEQNISQNQAQRKPTITKFEAAVKEAPTKQTPPV